MATAPISTTKGIEMMQRLLPHDRGDLAIPAAHHREDRPLGQRQVDPAQDLLAVERLPHVPKLDERAPGGHVSHQNIRRKSFVMKKSEMITPIATCTTVAVVERPRPSVPPSVASPL